MSFVSIAHPFFRAGLAWQFILTTLIWLFFTRRSHYPCHGRGYCPKRSLSGIDLRHLQAYRSYSIVENVLSDFLVQSHLLDCDVLSPSVSHFSVTLSIDKHYLSTFSSRWRVNTWTFGLHPTSPYFYYPQSHSRQTSINGARWGDNEAPRQRFTEVGEWQRHTELSLSHRNEKRTWKRSEAASWTNLTELGKLIPLCLE